MRYISHNAIVVTACNDRIEMVAEQATKYFNNVSPIMNSYINGYRSFFIPPDGSKEGWSESFDGDIRREAFITYLKSLAYSDGSSSVSWVEIQYGDDSNVTKICSSSDDEYLSKRNSK